MFPSFFDNFFSRDLMDWNNSNFSSTNSTLPAVNIRETDESFLIEVAAPGLAKENFRVNLNRNRLVISSEQRNEKDQSDKKYSRREFSYQSFERSFFLPEGTVDGDRINAKYIDGILLVTLPKREEIKPKPAREIEIM
ncbi:MAG: Hsp20/alpha crystallin family protein [Bacteroidia bacterium]|nr:Hsp20/alpha crystallin family protein [Bacteroidia bacterium]